VPDQTDTKTVVGFFSNRQDAESAVAALVDAGVSRDHLGVVSRDYRDAGDAPKIGPLHGAGGADTVAGGAAAVGGLAGFVAGLLALASPGIGPILAAGPLAAGLMGAGVGAAAGGLIGYLKDMGVSEDEAEYYAEGVRRGGSIVAVRSEEGDVSRITDILNDLGATDVKKQAAEWRSSGWRGFDPEAEPLPRTRRA
jgi:hypothetical protein